VAWFKTQEIIISCQIWHRGERGRLQRRTVATKIKRGGKINCKSWQMWHRKTKVCGKFRRSCMSSSKATSIFVFFDPFLNFWDSENFRFLTKLKVNWTFQNIENVQILFLFWLVMNKCCFLAKSNLDQILCRVLDQD
jgi:hypothetical protein